MGDKSKRHNKQSAIRDDPGKVPCRVERKTAKMRDMSQCEIKDTYKCGIVLFRRKWNVIQPRSLVTLQHFCEITLGIFRIYENAGKFKTRAREKIS